MLESNTILRIEAIFDYIVKIKGKYSYKQNQIFQLKRDKNIKFFLISATIDSAYLITNKNDVELIIGDELIESKEDFLISTKENYFGKIIDIYGNII
jgi:ATP synthase F1, alpha subunit